MDTSCRKVYVKVNADFTEDGRLRPKSLEWEDGTTFSIDRILDQRRAASLKAGGAGIRYTCVINGHQSYLFYEENFKWFVEAKSVPS